MPVGDLTREELVDLVRRLQSNTADEKEEDRLVERFNDSVPHPRASDLIFYPELEFGEDYRNREPTAEEVVDRALGYRASELRACAAWRFAGTGETIGHRTRAAALRAILNF